MITSGLVKTAPYSELMAGNLSPCGALFLDRDGTLIVHRPYLADPDAVELLPGVRPVLHKLLEEGWRLFLFTNQSGVGRGFFSLDRVILCNNRMLQLLDLPPPGFTEMCIATETPGMPQVYRKPSPRFINEMVVKYSLNTKKVWMIGDSESDVQAGLNAGVRCVLMKQHPPARISGDIISCPDFRAVYKHLAGKVVSIDQAHHAT